MYKSQRCILIAALLVLFSNQSLFSQGTFWTAGAGSDTNYSNTNNWTAGVPLSNGIAFFELPIAYTVSLSSDADVREMFVANGDMTLSGGNQLTVNTKTGILVNLNSHLTVSGTGTRLKSDNQLFVEAGSELSVSSATIEVEELTNEGLMTFVTGFANLESNVVNRPGSAIEVTTFSPVNFLRDFRNNGQLYIEAGERVNFFGEYTGRGLITGTGVVHFKGPIEPGVNDNPFLFGTINMSGDAVIETTSNLHVRINGDDQTGGDQVFIGGDLDIQSATLTLAANAGDEIFPGDEFMLIEVAGSRTGTFQGMSQASLVQTFGDRDMLISYFGGDGNDIVLTAVDNGAILGDVNQDGSVDLLDVGPFVSLLTLEQFQAAGDVNWDGVVDLLDVGRFVDLIAGTPPGP